MGALERYDAWVRSTEGVAADHERVRTGPDSHDGPTLEEVYDEHTLAAIDAGRGEPRRRASRSVRAAAAAAAAGFSRSVHDDRSDDEPPVVGAVPSPVDRRTEPVTVILVPGDPAASVAIVRPWLFPSLHVRRVPRP